MRFGKVWRALSANAMSGDETEHNSDGEVTHHVITRLPWRHSAIDNWLRTFDQLHMSTRFNSSDLPMRGQFPHVRATSSRPERYIAGVVKGLPRNFYDPTYLSSLTERERKNLCMQDELDLSFSPEILRFVYCLSTANQSFTSMNRIARRFQDVKTRKHRPLAYNHPILEEICPIRQQCDSEGTNGLNPQRQRRHKKASGPSRKKRQQEK